MTRDDIDALWIEANLKAEVDYQKRLTGRDYQSFVVEHFADLIEKHLIASGYRRCAEGQRTTQWCGMVEEAVKEEREACAKVCEGFDVCDPKHVAAAIRARGEV